MNDSDKKLLIEEASDFPQRFRQKNPLARWAAYPLLLALSGGADSTALARLFHAFREEFSLKIYAAHANHGLRGEESDGDEAFVTELCRSLHIPLISTRLQIQRTPDGLENDARRARYAFLETAAETLGARYVVLAHHLNDQAETILYRILRGTGVSGLAGMAAVRSLNPAVTLLRPLLSFSRTEIINYLTSIGQEWRTDSTNSCTNYTRNRIREVLLPQLRQTFNPKLDEALVRLGELAGEMQTFVDEQTAEFAKKFVRFHQDGALILPPDSETSSFLLCELFRYVWRQRRFPEQQMGRNEWILLVSMLLNEPESPSAHVFPGNIHARRDEQGIRIDRLEK